MMAEHVHEWYLGWIGDTVGGKCRGCPQTLLLNEIEARINEHAALKRELMTERKNALEAMLCADWITDDEYIEATMALNTLHTTEEQPNE